ncbi:bifunctional metallophosphatase/5'-nucleotidase [Latilactobacillus graminis]|uniref:Calcineurin-like phosphoesterase family protein n=2 Tax=Latilactobacillus graminis TaxID=60519 RepID=A0AA89I2V8_9LACO|nr:bifunctional metallophosphatase/5'-nucleotidase [Latilactobacillus graminis]KRM24436.1 calcineurin-like phosphoesterase family protein [Latilactobacillus graminis DSM 20719]QFP80015.1 bifunctional metallophosphatase/5'-nucleotidase [Latilactobacillus graminis]
METIHILHTNDLHSHFENWPRIRRFLLAHQTAYRKQGATVLTFDIGDAMDRSHPLTEVTNGQINTELLNQIGYDGVTIGNNEGVGNSHTDLEHLYDHANFPIILANLYEQKKHERPQFAEPNRILTTDKGTRVAVIALTAPFFLTYRPNGWEPTTVSEELPRQLAGLQGQYDVLIVLSHLGLTTDKWLAKHFPEIDVICGAHTHHLLEEGLVINQTLLTAAEKYGHYIGDITIELDDHHQITDKRARTILTTDLPVAKTDAAEIAGYLETGHAKLAAQKVANLPHSFKINAIGESEMMTVGLKAIEEATGTEAAVLNTGLFLQDLQAGIVTKDDLQTQLPHPMHLIKVTLKGYDLWRMVLEMEKNRLFLRKFPIKGMSFRGKIFGDIVYDGIAVDRKLRRVFWQGQEIDPAGSYTLTTVDHYLFIPFFPTIEIVGETEIVFPDFLRNAVAKYLSKHYPL